MAAMASTECSRPGIRSVWRTSSFVLTRANLTSLACISYFRAVARIWSMVEILVIRKVNFAYFRGYRPYALWPENGAFHPSLFLKKKNGANFVVNIQSPATCASRTRRVHAFSVFATLVRVPAPGIIMATSWCATSQGKIMHFSGARAIISVLD